MADFDLNKFVETLKEGFNDLVGQVKEKLGDTSKVSEEKSESKADTKAESSTESSTEAETETSTETTDEADSK